MRMGWCSDNLISGETFQNVIFVDETNVEMNIAARLSFYKTGTSFDRVPARCAKPKHAIYGKFYSMLWFVLNCGSIALT